MRWSLRVIFVERPAGTVATRLHAQEDHSASVGESSTRLPACLAGFVEIKVLEAGSIGVYEGRLAL